MPATVHTITEPLEIEELTKQLDQITSDPDKLSPGIVSPEGKTEPTASRTGQPSSTKVEEPQISIFQSYFTEMNERTHDTMGSSQPEPERALEFLKQVEDFQ